MWCYSKNVPNQTSVIVNLYSKNIQNSGAIIDDLRLLTLLSSYIKPFKTGQSKQITSVWMAASWGGPWEHENLLSIWGDQKMNVQNSKGLVQMHAWIFQSFLLCVRHHRATEGAVLWVKEEEIGRMRWSGCGRLLWRTRPVWGWSWGAGLGSCRPVVEFVQGFPF